MIGSLHFAFRNGPGWSRRQPPWTVECLSYAEGFSQSDTLLRWAPINTVFAPLGCHRIWNCTERRLIHNIVNTNLVNTNLVNTKYSRLTARYRTGRTRRHCLNGLFVQTVYMRTRRSLLRRRSECLVTSCDHTGNRFDGTVKLTRICHARPTITVLRHR